MQDKSAAGSGFTLRVAASFNPAVNATVRGNSPSAFVCLFFAAHVALPPALEVASPRLSYGY